MTPQERTRLLARVSLAGTVLVLVVIVTSAFLRLVQFGVGCEDWPACYGAAQAAPGASRSAYAYLVPWMRVLHRIAAAGVGLLAIVVAACACSTPRRPEHVVVAVALAALTMFLAVLGRAAAGSQLPAVTLGNVLGGMAMLGLFWWLRLECSAAPRAGTSALLIASALAALLLAIQFALGTLVSAHHASAACPDFPGCHAAVASGWDFAAFNPWNSFGRDAAAAAARSSLHMAHRWGAWIVLAYLGGLLVVLWRHGVAARALAAAAFLLCTQFALGIAVVLLDVPLVVTAAHNGVSGVLLIAVLRLTFHSRPAEGASVSAACQMVISK